MMRVLDLFSGIGGFSLGLERTGGFKTIAFCEIDPYCRRVLAKHWPGVPIYEDVKEVFADTKGHGCGQGWARGVIARGQNGIPQSSTAVGPIDVICGGFPCQDISLAGKGAGIEGERSGLWSEYARLIGQLRPRYIIVENVAALLARGLGTVLGDLAALGFDAEWHCIPASAVGALHVRDRVWLIAYPNGEGEHAGAVNAEVASLSAPMADADQSRLEGWSQALRPQEEWRGYAGHIGAGFGINGGDGWWVTEPNVGRVADGVPARVDRLRGLGNAVVPQVVELIGRAILESGR